MCSDMSLCNVSVTSSFERCRVMLFISCPFISCKRRMLVTLNRSS
jgi:hypothetical protein